jgi:hypothetical protein
VLAVCLCGTWCGERAGLWLTLQGLVSVSLSEYILAVKQDINLPTLAIDTSELCFLQ